MTDEEFLAEASALVLPIRTIITEKLAIQDELIDVNSRLIAAQAKALKLLENTKPTTGPAEMVRKALYDAVRACAP